MIETYAETIENMIKEEMQKKLGDMIIKNEKLKEKNEYLQKEVEDAKAAGERALCEVKELTEKNKRLVEEHNRQNGTIQALNIALDVITDRYSNLIKKEVYEQYAHTLREKGHVADAMFVECLVEDVSEELKTVECIINDLISTGYDMVYITEIQSEIHDKYKKKMKGIEV